MLRITFLLTGFAVVFTAGLLFFSPRGHLEGRIISPVEGTIHIAAYNGISDEAFPSGRRIGHTFIPHEGPYLLRNLPTGEEIYLFASTDSDGSGDLSPGDYYSAYREYPLVLTRDGLRDVDLVLDRLEKGSHGPVSPGATDRSVERLDDGSLSVPGTQRLHYRSIRTWEVGEGLSRPGGNPLDYFTPYRGFLLVSTGSCMFLSALLFLVAGRIRKGGNRRGSDFPLSNGTSQSSETPGTRGPEITAYTESRPGFPRGSGIRFYFFLLLNLCVGGILRFIRLGSESLEHLEATYLLAGSTAPSLFWSFFSRVAVDQGHQPFYHGLLYLWTGMAGGTLADGRMLSAIFGMISLVMTFVLASKATNSKAALCATALLAVSPLHVWYSRDLTPYTLMTVLDAPDTGDN